MHAWMDRRKDRTGKQNVGRNHKEKMILTSITRELG